MTDFILPISIAMSLIIYGLVARWYVMPSLRGVALEDAVIPFLLFHSSRYIGLTFLIPGVTRVELNPAFAVPAAYGDLAAAVLALLAAVAMKRRLPVARALAWIFSVVGSLDLINALYKGFRLTSDGDLGATFFIPAVIVPALLVTHVIVVILLVSRPERTLATASS